MKINIRELLGFHTRFEFGEGGFAQYMTTVRDTRIENGVHDGAIVLSDTHQKLIQRAQKQNILHKDVGYVRALRLSDSVYFYDVGLRTIDGNIFSRGTSLNLDEAVARAFGELYERVSMRFVPANVGMVQKSYKQIQKEGIPVLPVEELAKATKKQKDLFPELIWDEGSPLSWVTAQNIHTGESTYVPAQLVYWEYRRFRGEPILREVNTSGLGAGYTNDEAIASAAGELVQRHSFFYFWYAKKTPPKISVVSLLESSHCSAEVRKLIEGVLHYGLTIHLVNCTLKDSAPSVAVILTKPGLGWFVGMSTSSSYEKAIERGVCEALSLYTWVLNNPEETVTPPFGVPNITEGFCDKSILSSVRIRAWSHQEIAKHGAFFLEGEEHSFEHMMTEEFTMMNALATIADRKTYVVRATSSYLYDMGFHAVRVIAPHIHTLTYNEYNSTPILDGVEPKNTYPHPFP